MTPRIERLLVLSDLHLAPESPGLPGAAMAPLAAFLETVRDPATTLVLAGDTFDLLLLKGHPGHLALAGQGPGLFARLLSELALCPAGARVLAALAGGLRAGVRVVVIPGNHDLELHHPHCRPVLLDALGLPQGAPLLWHHTGGAWTAAVGAWEVVVAHGHRGDVWNDLDPDTVLQALELGTPSLPLPPGSRLVLDHLSRVRAAVQPVEGRARFPWVDLLQPNAAAALALLALEPRYGSALMDLSPTVVEVARKALYRRLKAGPTLDVVLSSPEPQQGRSSPDPDSVVDLAGDALLAAAIERELYGALTPGERMAPDLVNRRLLQGGAPPSVRGTLSADGSGRSWISAGARYLLRTLGRSRAFDEGWASPFDSAVIFQHLPPGCGPRVVIAGHTHAARQLHLMDQRTYLNTGTWCPVMELPPLDNDDATRSWLARLSGDPPPWQLRLRYAEVTADGPALRTWEVPPPDGNFDPASHPTTAERHAGSHGPEIKEPPGRSAEKAALLAGGSADKGPEATTLEGEALLRAQARARLHQALTEWLWEIPELKIIAHQAALPLGKIPWQGSAEQAWEAILTQSEPLGRERLHLLIATAAGRYPESQGLRTQLEMNLREWIE